MENGPFIDDFPVKTSIYKGFSMAMLNNQMVYIYICKIRARSKDGTCRRDFWPMWSEKAARGVRPATNTYIYMYILYIYTYIEL